MAGSEIPGVIVNMSRSGPGLGGISPSQGDYFQATRGGGHGDYRTLVLAPFSAQENYDLTMKAFDLADQYRNPVMILGDALLGQIKEPVTLRPYQPKEFPKPWALTGAVGRKAQNLKSLYLTEGELTVHNWNLFQKYQSMKAEIEYQTYLIEDADLVVVSFGSVARIIKSSIDMAREQGMKVGLFRPITLYPYPEEPLRELSRRISRFFVVELNTGQMVEDVKLSVDKGAEVDFYGRPPGSIPTPNELLEEIIKSPDRNEAGFSRRVLFRGNHETSIQTPREFNRRPFPFLPRLPSRDHPPPGGGMYRCLPPPGKDHLRRLGGLLGLHV